MINSQAFSCFFSSLIDYLISKKCNLKKTVFIMDNYTIHKSGFFNEKFGDYLNMLYLPAYSPQLNPIERIFSVWKSYVRRREHLVEDILAMHICEKANNFKT